MSGGVDGTTNCIETSCVDAAMQKENNAHIRGSDLMKSIYGDQFEEIGTTISQLCDIT